MPATQAQFRSEVSKQKIDSAPKVADDLACSTAQACPTAPHARSSCVPRTPTSTPTGPSSSKRLALAAVRARGSVDPGYDFTTFPEVVRSAQDAYAQAGITDPQQEISLVEVHDRFTPTEPSPRRIWDSVTAGRREGVVVGRI